MRVAVILDARILLQELCPDDMAKHKDDFPGRLSLKRDPSYTRRAVPLLWVVHTPTSYLQHVIHPCLAQPRGMMSSKAGRNQGSEMNTCLPFSYYMYSSRAHARDCSHNPSPFSSLIL
jgi:hypothetical protein